LSGEVEQLMCETSAQVPRSIEQSISRAPWSVVIANRPSGLRIIFEGQLPTGCVVAGCGSIARDVTNGVGSGADAESGGGFEE
jgi:hypothetical protein